MIRISARARREIIAAATWWVENRDKAPWLFDEELQRALDLIAFAPFAGRRAVGTRIKDARVIVLQRIGYLLFYRVVEGDHVRVLSLVHGRRHEIPPI
jgi:plasmid stabilization system protein ParE